jgi:hypothetical protein
MFFPLLKKQVMWQSNTKVIGIYIFTSCLYGICLSFGNWQTELVTENVGF